MARYLIDANLPDKLSVWHADDFLFVAHLGSDWSDSQVWEFAREKDMVIVSKDADFSDRVMVSNPPPRVIHFRTGNMRLAQFREFLIAHWQEIARSSERARLVIVSNELIELIECVE